MKEYKEISISQVGKVGIIALDAKIFLEIVRN